jgi:hypothetical protein
VHVRFAHRHADLDGAHVARMLENVRHRDDAVSAVRFMNRPPEQRDRTAPAIDHALRPQLGGLESRGQRDHFEHRSGLERHRAGVIQPRFGIIRSVRRPIGVVAGIARQRQDLAILRVHHHHASTVRALLLRRGGEFALRHELQPLVDGQRQRRARLRLRFHQRIDAPPFDVGQHPLFARRSFEVRFQNLFDAGVAFFREVHAAQDVRGQRPVGIMPFAAAIDLDPVEPYIAQALRLCPGRFLLHYEIAAPILARRFQPRIQIRAVHAQDHREDVGRQTQIGHFLRIDQDRLSGHAHRQRRARTVKYGAPGSQNLDDLLLARPRQPGVMLVMHYLQGNQFAENDPAPDQDKSREPFQTTLQHAALRETITPPVPLLH